MAAATLFLTTKPFIRKLYKTVPLEWIYILPLETATGVNLTAHIEYTDGATTDQLISLGTLTKGITTTVRMDYVTRKWDDIDPTRTIRHIKAYVATSGDVIYYIPEEANTDYFRQFLYRNSLGGMDSFVCTGATESALRVEEEISRKFLESEGRTNNVLPGHYEVANNIGSHTVTVNSGFKPQKEIEAFAQARLHNDVLLVVHQGVTINWIRVLLEGDNVLLKNDQDSTWSVTFRYRYTYDIKALPRVDYDERYQIDRV